MSKISPVRYLESAARGPVGKAAERGFERVGLLTPVQKIYNGILSRLAVRNGEYRITVGNADASVQIDSRTEYFRAKSMFEDEILESLLSDIGHTDVFYDIGANMGIYSALVGDVLPGENIVAFEPHPSNAQRLRENLDRNGIQARVVEKALSDEAGEVSLAVAVESHTTSPGHNLVELNDSVKEYGQNSAEKVTTEMLKGDDLIENEGLPSPTVLKVDVEGAELKVLRGLEGTLERDDCRLVYCEVHRNHLPKFGGAESELHEFLESCGFVIEQLNDHGSKYHLRASKRTENPTYEPSVTN